MIVLVQELISTEMRFLQVSTSWGAGLRVSTVNIYGVAFWGIIHSHLEGVEGGACQLVSWCCLALIKRAPLRHHHAPSIDSAWWHLSYLRQSFAFLV